MKTYFKSLITSLQIRYDKHYILKNWKQFKQKENYHIKKLLNKNTFLLWWDPEKTNIMNITGSLITKYKKYKKYWINNITELNTLYEKEMLSDPELEDYYILSKILK